MEKIHVTVSQMYMYKCHNHSRLLGPLLPLFWHIVSHFSIFVISLSMSFYSKLIPIVVAPTPILFISPLGLSLWPHARGILMLHHSLKGLLPPPYIAFLMCISNTRVLKNRSAVHTCVAYEIELLWWGRLQIKRILFVIEFLLVELISDYGYQ